MKWVLGTLLGLNVLVFMLALFANQPPLAGGENAVLSEGTASIDLLPLNPEQHGYDCFNIGPIETHAQAETLAGSLASGETKVRLLSEPERTVAAWRVLLVPESESQVPEIADRLQQAGIENPYRMQNDNGESILSIGVFTYRKTAENLAASLIANGLDVTFARDSLVYPHRYWVNLESGLEPGALNRARNLLSVAELEQNPGKCESGLPPFLPEQSSQPEVGETS